MLQKLNSIGQTSTDNGRVIVIDKYGNVKKSPSTSYTVVSVTTTPYNVTQTVGNYVFLIDTTAAGGPVTMNLPTPVGNKAEYTFKKIDSGVDIITINPGVFTIDDDTSAIIYYQNTTGTIISDNSNWKIIF